MPYLVGDSFGGVQAAQTSEDQQRRLAFAHGMSNLLGSLRERNEMKLRNEQLDLERQVAQSRNDFAAREMGLRQQEALWRNAIAEEHNKLTREATEAQTGYYKWLEKQPNQASLRDQEKKEILAQNQAQSGYFDSPKHVLEVYPDFGEGQAGLLADMSQRARQQIQSDYETAKGVADTLNKHNELLQTISQTEKLGKLSWINPRAYYADAKAAAAALPALQKQLAEIAPLASEAQLDARKRSLVRPDPISGKFVPTVPQPQWGTSTVRPALTPEDQAGGAAPAPMGGTQGWTTGTTTATTPEDQAGGGAPLPAGTAAPTSTGTAKRKYSPLVYDRAKYWTQQGYDMPSALSRALQDEQALHPGGQ